MRQRDGTEALNRVRRLRRDQTPAERTLWNALRGRGLAGAKFRRQVWIGPYVIDFLCLEARLVIELDGGHHAEQSVRDERRSLFLRDRGLHVVRFWNTEVVENLTGVLSAIADCLPSRSRAAHGPLPLPSGEGR